MKAHFGNPSGPRIFAAMDSSFDSLLARIRACNACDALLPCGVRPVMSASPASRLVIVGQAPGRIVHSTGIPWDDKSGQNLREWLGLSPEVFYDPAQVALVPMGFCYPGTGKSGDLPPRPECAPLWHDHLMEGMPAAELVLLVGSYAQQYYLGKRAKPTLTETVRSFRDYLPQYFPLPHPSPRNNIWRKKNPWFAGEVLPELKEHVKALLPDTFQP
jgi:uracil-DNA glycosylase